MASLRLFAVGVLVMAVIVHASLPDLLRMEEEEKKTINAEEPEEKEEVVAKEEGKEAEEEEVDQKTILTNLRNFIDKELGFLEMDARAPGRRRRRRSRLG